MRVRCSTASSSLPVLALALVACSRDEAPIAAVVPGPVAPSSTTELAPDPPLERVEPPLELSPSQSRGRFVIYSNGVKVEGADDVGDVATPVMRRLVFQCSDAVTFAVRARGDELQVFPPGLTNSYIVFTSAPSASGARYTAPNAEF